MSDGGLNNIKTVLGFALHLLVHKCLFVSIFRKAPKNKKNDKLKSQENML